MRRRTLNRGWLAEDNLLRGSVNLAANNMLATGLGFVGWIVTTRLFTAAEVGTAAAWISTGALVANIAFLGAPGSLTRFLPGAADKPRLIRTALTLTLLVGAVLGLALGLVEALRAGVSTEGLYIVTIFIGYVVGIVAKAVAEAAAIAVRASHVALSATVLSNVTKIAAVAALGWLATGALGILAAQMITALVGVFILMRYLRRRNLLKGGAQIDLRVVRKMAGYSLSHYVNGLMGSLPILVLPVLVKEQLGAGQAGYWYVGSLMGTSLAQISAAVGQSLLVEGSHATGELRALAWRALRGLTAFTVPLVALSWILAPLLLQLFGPGYSDESLAVFRILALSTLLSPLNYVLANVFFVRRRIAPIFLVNAVNALTVLWLASRATSVEGVAWAWFIGEIANIAIYLAMLPLFRAKTDQLGV